MRKIICALIIIFIIVCFLGCLKFFTKSNNKKVNIGNNTNIKEIEKYLLNINSYSANVDVIIKSNKNENKYKLKQEVKGSYTKQTVLEPDSIANMEITYENEKLQIKNTQLNLSKVYNNYPYISNNVLFLTDFLKSYQESTNKTIEVVDGILNMKFTKNNDRYSQNQLLKVDMQNLKPISIEIQDKNSKNRVYILYNEIELNI